MAVVAFDAEASSCPRPVAMPPPDATPEQRLAMVERVRDHFLTTFAERDIVFTGKIVSLSPPIHEPWRRFHTATVRIKRALNNARVETVDVTVNVDIKRGDVVFVMAQKESAEQVAERIKRRFFLVLTKRISATPQLSRSSWPMGHATQAARTKSASL